MRHLAQDFNSSHIVPEFVFKHQIGFQIECGSFKIDDAIEAFIKQRTEAKNAKDYALADQIREQLKQAGIELEDVAGGLTQWRRI